MNISKDNLIEYRSHSSDVYRHPLTGSPIIVVDGHPFTVLPKSHVSLTSNESVWNTVDTTTIKHGTPCIAVGNKIIPLLPAGYLMGTALVSDSFDLDVNDGVPEGSISYNYEYDNTHEHIEGSGTLSFVGFYDGNNGFVFKNTETEKYTTTYPWMDEVYTNEAPPGDVVLRHDTNSITFTPGVYIQGYVRESVTYQNSYDKDFNKVTLHIPSSMYMEEILYTPEGEIDYTITASVNFYPNY